jgi:hypothetical protein
MELNRAVRVPGVIERGRLTGPPMKMIAEYLENAIRFERMARDEADTALKSRLFEQAAAYRELAEERAQRLKLPRPPR